MIFLVNLNMMNLMMFLYVLIIKSLDLLVLILVNTKKEAMTLRRIYCEGNLGIMKENHNLRRTRKKGLKNVLEQCLFSALALSIKKLIKYSKGQNTAYVKAIAIYFITYFSI
ncbi:transposase [Clostridium sp. WILCCON 0269]|uniref:Transposase n=1 Tax=Candidatus Clostridium eludens TaxID=3381663 RepID=A0ABW8SPZ0_9CLOT